MHILLRAVAAVASRAIALACEATSSALAARGMRWDADDDVDNRAVCAGWYSERLEELLLLLVVGRAVEGKTNAWVDELEDEVEERAVCARDAVDPEAFPTGCVEPNTLEVRGSGGTNG